MASDSVVGQLQLRGTAGTMVLEIPEGVTLTVRDGLTVGPNAILKGKGTLVGDVLVDGGVIAPGLPEPSSWLLLLIGLCCLTRGRRYRQVGCWGA